MEKIDRRLFKKNARNALKNNFWITMLVVAVASLLGAGWTGLLNSGSFSFSGYGGGAGSTQQMLSELEESKNFHDNGGTSGYEYGNDLNEDMDHLMEDIENRFGLTEEQLIQSICIVIAVTLIVFLIVYALIVTIQFLIGSFLGAPVGVGYRRFFMENRKGTAQFSDLFSAFSKGGYMQVVKTMFAANIRIFGWSLVFYFPGLVKYYQYFFVSYVMAENPGISKERAREISTKMTQGHKWQMFVMSLSFIGWYLLFVLAEVVLALISCGLLAIPGMVLIFPIAAYKQASFAELYTERREYALMTGMAGKDELIGF